MSNCSECGRSFDDENGHGVCFGCKIQGITFGGMPNPDEPSKYAVERDWVNNAKLQGKEIERATDSGRDKRLSPQKPVKTHRLANKSDVKVL